jgi:choline monooxygenase
VSVNWKVYVENGLDGYHIRFVHDVLADFLALELQTATNHIEAHSSYTLAPMSKEFIAQLPPDVDCKVIRFGLVYPNLIPVFTPLDLSYLRIDPIAHDRVRITARSFDHDGPGRMTRDFRKEAFDRTNKQDIAVVERVQRGLQAPSLPAGIHSTLLEGRIGHFETMWRRSMRSIRSLAVAA